MSAHLTKAETVALWYAISWMEICLRRANEGGDETPELEMERERLPVAKRALRKVNAIRKEQGLEAKAVAKLNQRIDSMNAAEREKATGGKP